MKEMQEVLDFLNSIEGDGYGGMASFEIARMHVREAVQRSGVQTTAEIDQHIAWLYQLVRCMNESNWRDMCASLERQLERLSSAVSSAVSSAGVQTEEVARQVERMGRCVTMAMGCLDPQSKNPDEALAWHRLLDALEGNEPRPSPSRQSGGR